MIDFQKINELMTMAFNECERAEFDDEVPVGAVLYFPNTGAIFLSHNTKEKNQNPIEHAEVNVINEASKFYGSWRFNNSILITTFEPCTMCMAIIIQSRVQKVIFGAYDFKGGAISLGFNLHQNLKLNHSVEVIGGINHFDCSKKLSNYFRKKRDNYNSKVIL
jgi:tRNA(adenine34) deaminase